MGELTVKNVLEEICAEEYALPTNAPRHRFSLRHRRAMRKLFYPDNLPQTEKSISLKRRAVVIAAIVVLAVVTGAAAVIRYGGFRFLKYRWGEWGDSFYMLTENADKAPQTIEKLCYNNNVPERYKLFETGCYERDDNVHMFFYDSDPAFDAYRIPERPIVRILQMTKKRFITSILPGMRVEPIEIKGFSGFLMVETINENGTKLDVNTVLWDCGDYIHMVCGTIPMEELMLIIDRMSETT